MTPFEKEFAVVAGGAHAFAFWKGRTALYAILKALGIGPGNEVIVPGFTCVVVPNAVRALGAKPIYADIDPRTFNIDPVRVQDLFSSRTRAVIVQHSFGIAADMDRLMALQQNQGLHLIEDCAHTVGSTWRGRKLGTFGTASFFSTQWSKPFTTGLGGVAVTSDGRLARRLRELLRGFRSPEVLPKIKLSLQYLAYSRLFSSRTYWKAHRLLNQIGKLGFFVPSSSDDELSGGKPRDLQWKMGSSQARIGLRQLKRLEDILTHRRRLSRLYQQSLEDSKWPCLIARFYAEQPLLRYPVLVDNKWDLLRRAESEQIELGSWFESPLHPVREDLDRFDYREGCCPRGERLAEQIVNLPLHPRVSDEDAARVLDFFLEHAVPPLERREDVAL